MYINEEKLQNNITDVAKELFYFQHVYYDSKQLQNDIMDVKKDFLNSIKYRQ